MNNIYINISLLLSIVFLSGCIPKPMYYWENYSQTLYHYQKYPSDDTRLRHFTELEHIISISNENEVRVPPGVYAELGYLYMQKNMSQDAIHFFCKEKSIYPEASVFMNRLISGHIRPGDNAPIDASEVECKQ